MYMRLQENYKGPPILLSLIVKNDFLSWPTWMLKRDTMSTHLYKHCHTRYILLETRRGSYTVVGTSFDYTNIITCSHAYYTDNGK